MDHEVAKIWLNGPFGCFIICTDFGTMIKSRKSTFARYLTTVVEFVCRFAAWLDKSLPILVLMRLLKILSAETISHFSVSTHKSLFKIFKVREY